jgi:monofunctional biosynthetic peptidoglycan transglycosylase
MSAWVPQKRRSKRWSFRRIINWAIRGFVIFVLVSLAWALLYRFVPPPVTFTQIGDVLGGRSISRDWMSLDHIDRDMVRAAIAAEDSKFCTHQGFDRDAIAEAMRRNARGGSVIRGGSTISQQTAKNAFLWQGGGFFRKGLEAWFTMLIENLWDKRRIMEVYLNIAETGIGTYGVNAGAQRYFKHDASNMTRTEAARIAAVLPLPKKRGAVAPRGFTRRYGNSITARIGVVARSGLDTCIYRGGHAQEPADIPAPKRKSAPGQATPPPAPVPTAEPPPSTEPLPGEEYEVPIDLLEPTEEPTTEPNPSAEPAPGIAPEPVPEPVPPNGP